MLFVIHCSSIGVEICEHESLIKLFQVGQLIISGLGVAEPRSQIMLQPLTNTIPLH